MTRRRLEQRAHHAAIARTAAQLCDALTHLEPDVIEFELAQHALMVAVRELEQPPGRASATAQAPTTIVGLLGALQSALNGANGALERAES